MCNLNFPNSLHATALEHLNRGSEGLPYRILKLRLYITVGLFSLPPTLGFELLLSSAHSAQQLGSSPPLIVHCSSCTDLTSFDQSPIIPLISPIGANCL